MSKKVNARDDAWLVIYKDIFLHKGYPPTITEMMDATGVKSTSMITASWARLNARGLLDISYGKYFPLGLLNHIRGFKEGNKDGTVETAVSSPLESGAEGTTE